MNSQSTNTLLTTSGVSTPSLNGKRNLRDHNGRLSKRVHAVPDRLETDMRMGHDAGMATALVLTAVTARAQAEQVTPRPTLILENIGELIRHLG